MYSRDQRTEDTTRLFSLFIKKQCNHDTPIILLTQECIIENNGSLLG
uniref:Uncharacterized protein n=1 Tax=Anguilla anguilla TaxID=7936 RepID=A0A0E9UKX7_ANGAN